MNNKNRHPHGDGGVISYITLGEKIKSPNTTILYDTGESIDSGQGGGLTLSYGIWYLGKALMVGVTGELVRCRRLLFGYPLKTRQLRHQEFVRFEVNDGATMSVGNKTTVYYQLLAVGKDGQKLRVAERLTSRAEVELLKETYESYLGG